MCASLQETNGFLSSINFISLELTEGSLLLKYNSGYEPLPVAFGDELSDGKYHSVLVDISISGSIQLYLDCTSDVDCQRYEMIIYPSVDFITVDFSTIVPFYVGGVEPPSQENIYHLTSSTSFVGSISNFSINGELLNLLPNSSSTTVRSRNVVVNYQRVNQCENEPCMNGGHCIDLWFNYQCQCPPAYTGEHCDFLFLVNFDNNSYLYVEHATPMMSLSLHFSTLNENGALLSTGNVSS